LAEQKECTVEEGHLMPDHVHKARWSLLGCLQGPFIVPLCVLGLSPFTPKGPRNRAARGVAFRRAPASRLWERAREGERLGTSAKKDLQTVASLGSPVSRWSAPQ